MSRTTTCIQLVAFAILTLNFGCSREQQSEFTNTTMSTMEYAEDAEFNLDIFAEDYQWTISDADLDPFVGLSGIRESDIERGYALLKNSIIALTQDDSNEHNLKILCGANDKTEGILLVSETRGFPSKVLSINDGEFNLSLPSSQIRMSLFRIPDPGKAESYLLWLDAM